MTRGRRPAADRRNARRRGAGQPPGEHLDDELLPDDEGSGAELDELDLDHPEEQRPFIGRVAVVGYPNVGKSTLVNRLSGSRTAIVHETPGVTRDRKEVPVEWNGERFLLIDTGGVDIGDPRPMAKQIIDQVQLALADADVVMLVVDAKQGVSAADMEIAELLRERRVGTIVVANKIDNPRREAEAMEFYQLGLGDPMPVSAHHGNNTGDLLDELVDRLREHGTSFVRAGEDEVIRVALLGRPNVGKSTLVNAMLGNDRVIVSEVAGTTRDSIDIELEFEGRQLVLVDTAGIRRKRGKERDNIEFYSEVRSLQAAERAHVAIVLVDASQGIREADLAIADQVRQRDCATLIALSKWDINSIDLGDVQQTINQKLRQRPEVVTTSGITGRNVVRLLEKVIDLHGRYSQRIPTGELKQEAPPPGDKRTRRRLNLLYGTQYQVAPPRFRIVVNDRRLMTRSYGYFLENRLRERFHFEGCPLIIDYKDRS